MWCDSRFWCLRSSWLWTPAHRNMRIMNSKQLDQLPEISSKLSLNSNSSKRNLRLTIARQQPLFQSSSMTSHSLSMEATSHSETKDSVICGKLFNKVIFFKVMKPETIFWHQKVDTWKIFLKTIQQEPSCRKDHTVMKALMARWSLLLLTKECNIIWNCLFP